MFLNHYENRKKTSNHQVDHVKKEHYEFCVMTSVCSLKNLLKERMNKKSTKNLQTLMLQICKCLSQENPSVMWTFFDRKDVKFELRTKNLLQLPKRNTSTSRNNPLLFKGVLIWNALLDTIKNASATAIFKRAIKDWNGQNCT